MMFRVGGEEAQRKKNIGTCGYVAQGSVSASASAYTSAPKAVLWGNGIVGYREMWQQKSVTSRTVENGESD